MASDHNRFARREVTPTLNHCAGPNPHLLLMRAVPLDVVICALGPRNRIVSAARCWPILAVSARS